MPGDAAANLGEPELQVRSGSGELDEPPRRQSELLDPLHRRQPVALTLEPLPDPHGRAELHDRGVRGAGSMCPLAVAAEDEDPVRRK